MEDICGQSLAERQAKGLDLGTSVRQWPQADQVMAWARELLGLPASVLAY